MTELTLEASNQVPESQDRSRMHEGVLLKISQALLPPTEQLSSV